MRSILFLALVLCAFAQSKNKQVKEVEGEAAIYEMIEGDIKAAAKAVIQAKGVEADEAGVSAAVRVRERSNALAARKVKCDAMTDADKQKDCVAEWQKDSDRNGQEAALLDQLQQCGKSNPTDLAARKECVRQVAIAFIQLKPKLVKVDDEKKGTIPFVQEAAAAAAQGKVSAVEEAVAKAVIALEKNIISIEALKRNCRDLSSTENFESCMKKVRELEEQNKLQRELVKQLKQCASVNAAVRVKCVEEVNSRIVFSLVPPTTDLAPQTRDGLDEVQAKAVQELEKKITELQVELSNCKDKRCRRQIQAKIKENKAELQLNDKRFEPRRSCLEQRNEMRAAEFTARSEEHGHLADVHQSALDCSTASCIAEHKQEQEEVEQGIASRRAEFKKQWEALRCPLVAGRDILHFDVEAAVAPVRKSTPDTLIGMKNRLAELQQDLTTCETGECKSKINKEMKKLKSSIEYLENLETEKIDHAQSVHAQRAALHSRITASYNEALQCADFACRELVAAKVRRMQQQLTDMTNDAEPPTVQTFVRMLETALNRCVKGDEGRSCRAKVLTAFRSGTEMRQRALIFHLIKVTKRTASRNSEKCVSRYADNNKALAMCVSEVRETETKRLYRLERRVLRLERNAAIRQCRALPKKDDRKKCIDTHAKATYESEKKDAKRTARKLSAADVAAAVQNKKESEIKCAACLVGACAESTAACKGNAQCQTCLTSLSRLQDRSLLNVCMGDWANSDCLAAMFKASAPVCATDKITQAAFECAVPYCGSACAPIEFRDDSEIVSVKVPAIRALKGGAAGMVSASLLALALIVLAVVAL